MKYLNIIKLVFSILIISSCANQVPENEKKDVKVTPIEKRNPTPPKLDNPVLMNGSSFANYFQALYKLGRFDDMLLFTSKNLITKHGRKSILESYQKMNFAYEIKLKSIQNNNDSSYTLNYSGVQFATNKIIRIDVIKENDTIKLLKADFIKF
jgi:hypothetical protein